MVKLDQTTSSSMRDFIAHRWSTDFLEGLDAMIRIPSVSPSFSPNWAADGHIDEIMAYASDWLSSQGDPDLDVHTSRLDDRTPLVVATMPGSAPDAPRVLLYGHLDKQPGGEGWTKTNPWIPLHEDGRVFGRGSADDTYSLFAMWGAIAAAKASGLAYPACVLLLEGSEESSSCDLPAHMDALTDVIGRPDLVICLDAFTPDYGRLWLTSSLRGIVVMDVEVATLSQSTHSGDAGSIVPSPFRILRALFDRVEDAATGRVLLPELSTPLPDEVPGIVDRMRASGLTTARDGFPLLDGVESDQSDVTSEFLHRAWDASVTYAGFDGFPSTSEAASVILPSITARLSVRIPPNLDPVAAARALSDAFTTSPPSGATVRVDIIASEGGWVSAPLTPEMSAAVESASARHYGAGAAQFAAGVTIPFVGMLSKRFPHAQVLTLGALGPDSNPHSPDESLNLEAAEALTSAVAEILVTGFAA